MLARNFVKLSLWREEKCITMKQRLNQLGIQLDDKTGHLFYREDFLPIKLDFEFIFIRHGETYGNCGQVTVDGKIDPTKIKNKEHRIYQGDVDTTINQLTEYGKQQAIEVAEKLQHDFLEKDWQPDFILSSPLMRAQDTALPFIEKYHFKDKLLILEDIKEMSFGSWDNRRVCDLPMNDPCHLFYREQHALVKKDGINGNGKEQKAENFCDVLLRAHRVLMNLNQTYANKKIVMFSHSMFGAACNILLGKGQTIENGNYLAFDGKRSDGSYYTLPNAEPILLTGRFLDPRQGSKRVLR